MHKLWKTRGPSGRHPGRNFAALFSPTKQTQHGIAMRHRGTPQWGNPPLQLPFQRESTERQFPFCTIEPNLGVITVPDPRLNALADLVKPQNVVPTTVEIVDIAGL